ncbi:hypothetical protein CVT25_000586 [Psilocybe cyanescens]|uniref:Uncharacterized protein n=1 Tax=Psilocybe cyanescens TaxID=93625 RepID=A0A409W8N1_PSICY|nr:hypothetical protein CVT25_000586 [Psilocybe cyanescens]
MQLHLNLIDREEDTDTNYSEAEESQSSEQDAKEEGEIADSRQDNKNYFDTNPTPTLPPISSPTHPPSILPTPSPSLSSITSSTHKTKFLLPKRESSDSSSKSEDSYPIKHHVAKCSHCHTLPIAEMSPLAKVKVTKLKDCPMFTAGKITPLILHTWTNACKWFLKHSSKEPEDIVSFVADAMLEPCIQAWYQSSIVQVAS